MAKRTWNPASNVNQRHVTGMLLKGDADYIDFVGRIFTAKSEGNAQLFTELVSEGRTAGYFDGDCVDSLLGTKNAENVKIAAANDAKRQMVITMLSGGMEKAVNGLIKQGAVTEEFVATIKAQLEAVNAASEK